MPIMNRIGDYADEMKAWRQALHRMPELMFDCHRTAGFVAERLREIGVDAIHEGIAETGIVALIRGQGEGPVIGLGPTWTRCRSPRRRGSTMPAKCRG